MNNAFVQTPWFVILVGSQLQPNGEFYLPFRKRVLAKDERQGSFEFLSPFARHAAVGDY